MTRIEYPLMQNPGDTRLPEGVEEIGSKKRVLILNGSGLVYRDIFDKVVSLFPNGEHQTEEDEAQVLTETSF